MPDICIRAAASVGQATMKTTRLGYKSSMSQEHRSPLIKLSSASGGRQVSLDDKWHLNTGTVVMTGVQAIARALLSQSAIDRAAGRNTAGFVTGYRGSPLGGLDTALWSVRARLQSAAIRFQPGVNEELAATAVHGTQQVGLLPKPSVEGVFAAWYGKGPGVDRALDALKHGNIAGAGANGGVVCFYGDDHAGKSSTVAHQSEQAMASCLIPSLYPADAGEVLLYGLLGFSLSRYSGAWVGVKCVNETAEQTMTVDLCLDSFAPLEPESDIVFPEGVHARFGVYNPLRDEQIALEARLPRVHAFVRANRIDRVVLRAPTPLLGIVAAGKSFGDVQQALALLGLDPPGAAAVGISLYKVGCIWPLEPAGLRDFARGHASLLVVEDKKSFLEQQIAAILINDADRPGIFGKSGEDGRPLLSSVKPLEQDEIAHAIAGRLRKLGAPISHEAATAASACAGTVRPAAIRRTPYFCSGCPHNRSTQLPAGSLSMTGIGCHAMVNMTRPAEAFPAVQMGGEGANWIGIAPFSGTKHIFQNIGDGTYYHSGLLAIRAAVAAGVNITYKILYNDAVAMTGGQPVDGPLSVSSVAQQLGGEGVATIVVVSDDPSRHGRRTGMPAGVEVFHRDKLEELQRRLRNVPGVSVMIYEQTCAAEKRRRRRRGTYPDPLKRLFIAKSVCEGCGDCSVQSTCVSIQPVATAFGTKRRIDQASCNMDYSCVNGFCPSFLTVRNAEARRATPTDLPEDVFNDLPEPGLPPAGTLGLNLMIAGIGGTGVVTAASLIVMAANLDGKHASAFDMTGLAQKNGAVYSHVRIAETQTAITAQRIGRSQADILLAFDAVAATGLEATATLSPSRTRAVVNTSVPATAAFQFNRDLWVDGAVLLEQLETCTSAPLVRADAAALAAEFVGDPMMATSLLLGVASQYGLLPVRPSSIESAIRLNGAAIRSNIKAFRIGRLYVHAPDRLAVKRVGIKAEVIPDTLADIVAHRSAHLLRYQNANLVKRYEELVKRVADAEARVKPGSDKLACVVAVQYAKLLAYKDEYEVARLLTDPSLYSEISNTFGPGVKLSFNLAPPILSRTSGDRRPRKLEFSSRTVPLLRLLSRCKALRGTWADPFGRNEERRTERALITEYESLAHSVVRHLTRDNHADAVALLDLASEIRGFGPVKRSSIEVYRRTLPDLEAAFQLRRHAKQCQPPSLAQLPPQNCRPVLTT